jgi:hypothetical protein
MSDDLSLRDELIQASGLQSEQSIPAERAAPETQEAHVEKDTPTEGTPRERAPDGKFVKKAAAEAPDTQITDQPADEKAVEAAKEPVIKTPTSWSAEYKAKFIALPKEVQDYILKREGEAESLIGKKGTEAAQAQKQFAEINEVVDPYRDQIALSGRTPAQHFRSLLEAERVLQQNPQYGIQWLAKSYGIDLASFAQRQQPQPGSNLPPELQPLQQQVGQLTSYIQQQQQAVQQQAYSAAEQEIIAFAQTAEHYRDVEADLVPLVAQIKQANPAISSRDALKQAYEKAIWANPHTRALEIAKQDEARKAEAARLAKEAQRKNLGLTGAPTGMPGTAAPDTIRGTIEAAMRASRA